MNAVVKLCEPRPVTDTPVLAAYKRHRNALRRFVYQYVRNTHDVDDILQEAFERAYKIELTRPIEQPKSFLFKIARHAAIDQLNKTKLETCITDVRRTHDTHFGEDPRYSLHDVPPEDRAFLLSSPSAESEVVGIESATLCIEAMQSLPPVCRRVYELRLAELSNKEIGQQLGISVSTVEKHMIKALQRIPRG